MKNYFSVAHQLTILLVLIVGIIDNVAIADERQVIEFSYDLSGNIVKKNTTVTLNSVAPTITNITPIAIRRNTITTLTVSGTDLKNAQVSVDDPGLGVTNTNSSNIELTFDLNVSNDTTLGIHTFIFSTLSGQGSFNIDVFPQLPQMVIRPTPLAISIGSSTEVMFGISSNDVIDHQITLSVADSSIISISKTKFIITAGERFPPTFFNVEGLSKGTTTLTFSSLELGDQVFTVIVGDVYQPSIGTKINVRSDLLGIVLPTNSPDLKQVGPIVSTLSVFLTPAIEPITNIQRLQTSSLLQVVYGNAFTQVTPDTVIANSNTLITISGQGLTDVTAITLTPSDGITIGAPQINAMGTELTVSVAVDAGVSFSTRKLQLLTANAEIKPIKPGLSRLFIGGMLPVIKTVKPIVASRLTNDTLNITGQYFDGDVKVIITPSDDIDIGNIVKVNDDHTALSVDLVVSESAVLGARVVTIETLNGVTTQSLLPTNTLTIVNAIIGETLVRSLPVGITVGTPSSASKNINLFSAELSIVRGAGITQVQPLNALTGSSFTLTIKGVELNNVTEVSFDPAQDITLGALQVASDGLSITVDVTIAAEAQISSRQLKITAGGVGQPSVNIAFTKVENTRFNVLGPKPKINYLSPNFIIPGSVSTISIHGENFNSIDTINIIPPQGLSVSVPQINADNTIVTVQITAALDVQRGARVISLRSASGESSVVASAENQINVVERQILDINRALVSPLLGITKGNNPTDTITRNYIVTSSLLGIFIPEPVITETRKAFSRPLSVVKGGYVDRITPDALSAGTTSSLVISGVNMQNVSSIEVLPAQGVTVQSLFTINADGTKVSVNIILAVDAEKTPRRIIVHQNGNTTSSLPFIKAGSSLLTIAGDLPNINSIEPVLQVANSQFELLIRGQNLREVTAVQAYDSSGALEPLIVFSTPVINIDGSELRVTVVVDRLVPSGKKAIVLIVPIGQTETTTNVVNTLTIDTVIN